METYFRKTYYTDIDKRISMYINNNYYTTRLTIKNVGSGRREVYKDFSHTPTIITDIYEELVKNKVRGNTIREIIKDISNKFYYTLKY